MLSVLHRNFEEWGLSHVIWWTILQFSAVCESPITWEWEQWQVLSLQVQESVAKGLPHRRLDTIGTKNNVAHHVYWFGLFGFLRGQVSLRLALNSQKA